MIMDEQQQQTPMPKKSCMITIMFGIEDDAEALKVKQQIDDALKGIKEKRYSFGINEK